MLSRKKQISAILLAAILVSAAACGSESGADPSDDSAGLSDTTTAEVYNYPYPESGYGGQVINILSRDDVWGFMCHMDADTLTGDAIDDAQYERNRLVESKFDVVLKEERMVTEWDGISTVSTAQKSILAGDRAYDIMFLPLNRSSGAIEQNCFLNLCDIKSLQLHRDWWYDTYNDALTLDGILYGAMGGAQLMVQDSIRLLAFNIDMMKDLQLEIPYDTVREGKWTMDVFNSYLSAAANLNGDASAAFDSNGNTIYGITNHGNQMYPWMMGCGEITIRNANGTITDDSGSERWYNVIDKISSLLTTADAKIIYGDNVAKTYEEGNYSQIFYHERALFGFREFAALRSSMRELNFEYGVVPFPKYDEAQDQYYTNTYEGAISAFLPSTLDDAEAEKIGAVLDALAYEGECSVIPEYRGTAIEQKGLRDEDSIEMVGIIASSIVPSVHRIFDVGFDMVSELETSIANRDGKAASIQAKYKDGTQAAIEELMAAWTQE